MKGAKCEESVPTHRQVHRGVDGFLGHRGHHVESDVGEEDAGYSFEHSIGAVRGEGVVVGWVDLQSKVMGQEEE